MNDTHYAQSARQQGYQSCHVCTAVAPITKSICHECGSILHSRKPNSIQKTWAWLITSIILLIPANILPIMHTVFLGEESDSTILGGVITLWQQGSQPIAVVIFIASIFVPIAKIITLAMLCVIVQTRKNKSWIQNAVLYRITELVGRWSMIDVFVVIILVALIRMGNLMNIDPGPAALVFSMMVITTMFAAMSFDPRLLWDSITLETAVSRITPEES